MKGLGKICLVYKISGEVLKLKSRGFRATSLYTYDLSRVVRKPAFCICENKDADQLRGDREADQRHCFRYIASTIPLLP